MTFAQFWTILRKRWMLIAMCFLIIGIGTYIGSKLVTPLYQSTVLIQVALQAQNQSDVNSLLASDQLVQTESQLAVSDPVLQQVASHYKGLTADRLAREVASTTRLNTQLFEIDVQDPSPMRAAALANAIAATLIAQQMQVSQQNYNTAIQQIQTDLNSTQQQIDSDTTRLGQLQAGVNNLLEAQRAADSQAVKLNQALPQQNTQQVKQEATLQVQIAALQSQLTNLQQHYIDRQAVLAQLQLTEVQNSNFLRVVQAAKPARNPVSPQVLFITSAGLVIGMLLGILLAILFEQLDTRIRTSEEITQVLSWPVLAAISRQDARKNALVNAAHQSANSESYRILRTNIELSTIDKPLHSLVVTSALRRDGKSVIAANLAIFMARAGKNTLLIDADLRHPTQHSLFNLPADRMGLSNAVLAFSSPDMNELQTPSDLQFQNLASRPPNSATTGALSLASFVHSVDIPNLWVMPAGSLPPNPSELLDSKAMQRFLALIENWDVELVIFDTPPLLGLSDASILASKVDGALAVVDMTRATKGRLKPLKAVLAQTGVNVLGCVANKHRRSRDGLAYSDYYYQTEEQNDSEKHANNGRFSLLSAIHSSTVSPSPSKKERGNSNEK